MNMRGLRKMMLGTVGLAVVTPTMAVAQDVVVMRRSIAPPRRAAPVDPVNPPVGYYSWEATPWIDPPLACGAVGVSNRSVRCERTDGSTAEDRFCTGNGAGGKPEPQRDVEGGCGSSAGTVSELPPTGSGTGSAGGSGGGSGGGGTPTPGTSPGSTPTPAPGTTPTPTPSGGSTPTPAPGSTPSPGSTPTPGAPAPLTYGWTVGPYSAPSSTCGSSTSTRIVSCQRSDGAPASPDQCNAGGRPSETQGTYETSGCGHAWHQGEWDNPVASCGATTQTRAVTCLRSDGQPASDSACQPLGTKPATSRSATDYGTCTYAWSVGAFNAPNTTCGTVNQSRTVYCQRSDGNDADDAKCSGTKPANGQSSYQTSGCTFAWDAGAYEPATPACGASTHTRGVICKRSDGNPADADKCDAAKKPISTEPTTDYGTCTYDWYVGPWNGSTQCGQTVTQTRNVYCQRSNSSPVDDSLCSAKGAKPKASQPITDYSGCSYTPTYGSYGTCTNGYKTAAIASCVRSDGTKVDNGLCSSQTSVETCSATFMCEKLVAGKFPSGGSLGSYTSIAWTNPTEMQTKAKAVCEAKTRQAGASSCLLTTTYKSGSTGSGSGIVYASTATKITDLAASDGYTFWSSTCTGG